MTSRKRRYCELKQEELNRNLWGTCFFEVAVDLSPLSVIRRTEDDISEGLGLYHFHMHIACKACFYRYRTIFNISYLVDSLFWKYSTIFGRRLSRR
jgi:hypothetical protein